jgi:hypothetical protein
MTVSYVTEDPWEMLIFRFSEMMKDGVEVKISYGGMEAGVNFDLKALENLATLFEKGVPLEVAVGIDLPRMLSSIEGEELDITLKTKETELNLKMTGDVLSEFRKAMQHNPIDGEVLAMIAAFLKRLVA